MKSRTAVFIACFTLLAPLMTTSVAHALISFGPPAALNSTAATDVDGSPPDNDEEAAVASDGGSTWIALWSSPNSLSGTVGVDRDILISRSTDDGVTWSAAAALYANAASDSGSDTGPRIGKGTGSNWLAVWTSQDTLGGTVGADYDIFFSRSTDNGVTWSNPGTINSAASSDASTDSDLQPAIATDGAGTWVVAWRKFSTGQARFYYASSTDDGATWSTRTALGAAMVADPNSGQGDSVAYNGSDFVIVWSSTENLGGAGVDADLLAVTVDGTLLTASAPALVNSDAVGDSEHDSYPSLAANGSNMVLAWEQGTQACATAQQECDLSVATSADGGASWSAVAALNTNAATDTGTDSQVKVVTDGAGNWLAVWVSNDTLNKTVKSDDDILLARSSDNGASWTDPRALASNAGKDRGADAEPRLATNGSGTWIAVWDSTETLGKTVGADADILFVRSAEDCPAVAQGGCVSTIVPGKGLAFIKTSEKKDLLVWKVLGGSATTKGGDLGDPTSDASDDYVFCMYDQTSDADTLIIELDAAATGNCYAKPCWKSTNPGYIYVNKYAALGNLKLFAGEAGRSKVIMKAQTGFDAPALPLNQDSKVTAQLHNLNTGTCWSGEYSTSILSDGIQFKARND